MGIKKKHTPGCSCCEEPACNCTSGPADSYEIVITGITNTFYCSGCTNFNGTFSLSKVSDCIWEYEFSSDPCVAGDKYQLTLVPVLPDRINIVIKLLVGGTYSNSCWSTQTLDRACDVYDMDVPIDYPASGQGYCASGSSTCHLTAV